MPGHFAVLASALIVARASAGGHASLAVEAPAKEEVTTTGTPQEDLNVVKHTVRICNAFTSTDALDVYLGDDQLNYNPLSYKVCRPFHVGLKEGAELNFKAGAKLVGSFTARNVPSVASSLLLIAHRRNDHAKSLVFQSHVFAKTMKPQIACIDAYQGEAKDSIEITLVDAEEDASMTEKNASEGENKTSKNATSSLQALSEPPRSHKSKEKELPFGTVVMLRTGQYTLALRDLNGNLTSEVSALETKAGGTYVAMRVGSNRKGFEEEIVLQGAAAGLRISVFVAAVMAVALGGKWAA